MLVKVKTYENATVAVVGPRRPEGSHGHLVEGAYAKGGQWINIDVRHHSHGKPTGVILKKHPFVQSASEQTRTQQVAAIREGITAAVKKATGQ